MDGVLADTSQLHFDTWERVLTEQGIPFDRKKFQFIYGLKNHDLLPILTDRVWDIDKTEWLADQKELAFRQALPGRLCLLPGVLKWLQHFNSLGYRQAVASSAPPENVEALVDELGIRKYFSALVTPGNLPGKPDPAVFLLAASQLGVDPQDCVVIEDSIPGVEAACRAGMHTIAITSTNPPEVFIQADIVIGTMDELSAEQFEALF
jgi:HAD superfamily hydrolase (TIGR01509 family)